MNTRGVLYIHACPPALCPHVAWAVARELGMHVELAWSDQPAAAGLLRAECEWSGPAGTGGRLTSALKGWAPLRFEVFEMASPGCDGRRFSYTGRLGMFSTAVSANGDVMVGEDQLRAMLSSTGDWRAALDRALGTAWDDELEPFRRGGDGAPVTRIARVV